MMQFFMEAYHMFSCFSKFVHLRQQVNKSKVEDSTWKTNHTAVLREWGKIMKMLSWNVNMSFSFLFTDFFKKTLFYFQFPLYYY